ncbi:hypothetical protein BT93_G1611 [Corymbia citriodora subsp. variegata]|nr:hypothetical protein BT93_G1611 [Corymbia citriodora subsp. variegata]
MRRITTLPLACHMLPLTAFTAVRSLLVHHLTR